MKPVELPFQAVYAEGVIASPMKFHAFNSANEIALSGSQVCQRVTAGDLQESLKSRSERCVKRNLAFVCELFVNFCAILT